MKRVLLTVLVLALICSGLAPAETGAAYAGTEAFDGEWQCGDAFILADPEEDGYRILILMGSEAGQTEWEYSCVFDSEADYLRSAPFGIRREVVFDEYGEMVSSEAVYEDGEAVFFLNGDGCLIWQDYKENAGEGMVFTKLMGFGPLFATVGEALESEGFTGMYSTYGDYYVAVVEIDGQFVRVVAELDETALKLSDAVMDADDPFTAAEAYEAYAETLPVSYLEEIVQVPLDAGELDALSGKTIGELEENGFEALSFGEEGGAFTVSVAFGMYVYDITVNEPPEECETIFDGDMDYTLLTVKGARYAGISPNTLNLDYMPDGTYFGDEGLDTDVFGDSFDLMNILFGAVQSGDTDLDALAETLTQSMPDNAEEILSYIEQLRQMYSEDAPAGE